MCEYRWLRHGAYGVDWTASSNQSFLSNRVASNLVYLSGTPNSIECLLEVLRKCKAAWESPPPPVTEPPSSGSLEGSLTAAPSGHYQPRPFTRGTERRWWCEVNSSSLLELSG